MERIPESTARELWRRAAELQAAAERERPALAAGPGDPEGLSLAEVDEVALSAGIHPDHVRMALAEQGLADAAQIRRDAWPSRMLRALLREDADAIQLSELLPAEPDRVLEAVRIVYPGEPFGLHPEGVVGHDPLRDAVLVHRLAERAGSAGQSLNFADVRVVLTTVRAEAGGTRLRLRMPLYRRSLNLLLTGVAGAGGGWLGMAGGTALAGVLGAAAGLAAVPLAAGAGLGVLGYAGLYRRLLRGGEAAARKLIRAVAAESTAPRGRLPPG